MTKPLAVLVTGATGNQGGATARLLAKRGHRVRALTRNGGSAAAKNLAGLGIEVVQGDLEDRGSVERAVAGMDAMFHVGTPFGGGTEAETRHGINAADAAKAAGAFMVYSSVANADRKTGIPHFDSKFAVEQHLRAIGGEATIIAPAYFMENAFFGLQQLRDGVYASPLPPARGLIQVAVADIAAASLAAIEDRARHAGQRYDLGGDELTGEEQTAIFSRVIGRPFRYFQVPMEAILARMGDDGTKMYEWFQSTGYSVDRGALSRAFPDVRWLSLEAWARSQDWKALLGA